MGKTRKIYNKNILVCGYGVNDATYKVYWFNQTTGKKERCNFYSVWLDMLRRCSPKFQTEHPSYRGCHIEEDEWRYFMNFRSWMEKQPQHKFHNSQLDKDILIPGNKLYAPHTCIFVPAIVNSFITESTASRGKWPIGVSFDKESDKFKATIRNPFTKRNENIGRYASAEQAHASWLKRKLELAKQVANSEILEGFDERIGISLVQRYENYKIEAA